MKQATEKALHTLIHERGKVVSLDVKRCLADGWQMRHLSASFTERGSYLGLLNVANGEYVIGDGIKPRWEYKEADHHDAG